MIPNKVPNMLDEDKIVVLTNSDRTMEYLHRKNGLETYFNCWGIINFWWIIELNIKARTTNLPEENAGEYLCDLRLGKYPVGKSQTTNHKRKQWSFGLLQN